MTRRIIGLLGPRGAGKDTAALIIRDLLPGTFLAAFADPIRAMLSELLRVPEPYMKTSEWKAEEVWPLRCTGRQALNRLGEGMKALFHQDIWVEYWQWRVGGPVTNIVVPDVRTEQEIQAVLDLGGELWHVCRNGYSYTCEPMDMPPSIRIGDKYLLNYGGLMRFKQNVHGLLFPGKPVEIHKPAEVSGVGPRAATLVDAPDSLVAAVRAAELREGPAHD